jgi:hypothetical protein
VIDLAIAARITSGSTCFYLKMGIDGGQEDAGLGMGLKRVVYPPTLES